VAVTRTAAEEQQASSSTDNIGRPQQVIPTAVDTTLNMVKKVANAPDAPPFP
ncbi:unnamed protein product, partial [Ascophyllum nodosum]